MNYDVITRARPTTRRRLTAVCLAAAAVVGAVTFAVTAGGVPNQPATSPAGPPPDRLDTSKTATGRSDLPGDLRWADVSGVSVPVSSRSGPRSTGGGQARGFTHDRAGAVLAAVHIVVRVNPQVGSAIFEPTLRGQVIGSGAVAMRLQVVQAYAELRGQAGVADGHPVGRLQAALRGYRFLSFTDDEAVLRLLTEAPDASGNQLTASTEVTVRWTGSDWSLVAPAAGTFDRAVTVASDADIAEFLPFSAGG